MKGYRVFDSFGFRLPKTRKPKAECKLTDDYLQWQYDAESGDWLTEEHETTLTAFVPDHELETLIEMNIDTDLE